MWQLQGGGGLVTKLCPALCDAMDCSLPGSSVRGISQARILEWVAISFSRGSSPPSDRTWVSCVAGRFFTIWATREAQLQGSPIQAIISLFPKATWEGVTQQIACFCTSQLFKLLCSIFNFHVLNLSLGLEKKVRVRREKVFVVVEHKLGANLPWSYLPSFQLMKSKNEVTT